MSHESIRGRKSTMSLECLMQALSDWQGDCPAVSIAGVADDSRQVQPGWLFVAVKGYEADGHRFIGSAVERGAAAIVVEDPVRVDAKGVPILRVSDTRVAAARLAARFYRIDRLQAEGALRVVAVTGTNGKSTFCYLTRSIAAAAGTPCALLGTIEYDLIGRTVPARVTTPGPVSLASYIAEAAQGGAGMVVLEASSHALHQHRTDALRIDVAAFTNLSGDHQDYHGTIDEYLAAKKRLFDGLDGDAVAVLNLDDPSSELVAVDCKARRLQYGLNHLADVHARITRIAADGSDFELITPDGSTEVRTQLVGRHNIVNCLTAASTGVALGFDLATIRAGLEAVDRVAGRLERVVADGGDDEPVVLVDYAHTDDALRNVVGALAPLKRGRLIVVFGCGGDRDQTKRPRMARAAAECADRIVVTSDNPRTEEPEAIIDQILDGFEDRDQSKVTVEADRRKAIAETIQEADPEDIILIAGKGHEAYQILGRERVPFDDREIARACLAKRAART